VKLVGLMPVRNEAWCLRFSLRVALAWCDHVIVSDHGSTDESRVIAEDLALDGHPLTIRDFRETEWREMQQRQELLEEARLIGATHVAIVDADEVLTCNLLENIRPLVEGMARGTLLELPGYNLRGRIDRYHTTGTWGNRWFSVAFVDDPRLHWSGDRFHSRQPEGMQMPASRPIPQGYGGVLHLWGASERRLIAKHALYKVTERLRWPDKPIQRIDEYYNQAIHGSRGDPAFAWRFGEVPAEWLGEARELVTVDAVPWQEAEVRRLVAENGRHTFQGLNLFGLV